MGRHRAPEPWDSTASVVRLAPARLSRSRCAADLVPVDLAASGGFVDDLTLITADDQFLDCIAAGRGDVFTMPQEFSPGFPAGSLAPLLATWRSEIVGPQGPSVPTADQVQRAVRAELRPVVKRTRRALTPMLGVAVAISALLFGSAAAGANSAKPGDPLWALAKVLYSDRANSYAASDAAWHSLRAADRALKMGQPTIALSALTSASGEINKVELAELVEAKSSLWFDYGKLMTSAQARTPSVPSSEPAIASASSTSAGADGFGLPTTSVKPTPSGSSGPGNGAASSPGTATKPSGSRGLPTSGNSSRPPVTATTAPVIPPVNPTDPAPTPTGSATAGTSNSPPSPTPVVPVTTAPVTPPGSTDPVTTSQGTSAPSSVPSTDPVTTAASTTSALPTPTPAPAPSSTPSDPGPAPAGPNAASVAPAAIASQ